MATKVDINRVKYYKSRLPLTVITKWLKKFTQLLIGRPIYRGLPISVKSTVGQERGEDGLISWLNRTQALKGFRGLPRDKPLTVHCVYSRWELCLQQIVLANCVLKCWHVWCFVSCGWLRQFCARQTDLPSRIRHRKNHLSDSGCYLPRAVLNVYECVNSLTTAP